MCALVELVCGQHCSTHRSTLLGQVIGSVQERAVERHYRVETVDDGRMDRSKASWFVISIAITIQKERNPSVTSYRKIDDLLSGCR